MTRRRWTYPPELVEALGRFGLLPHAATPPLVVRDALNDLYRYELRRLRDRLRQGAILKADYIHLVIQKRKQYWPLTLQPDAWDRICSPAGAAVQESPDAHRSDSATRRRRRGR